MVGSSLLVRNKRRSNESNVVKRYLAAVDRGSPGDSTENHANAGRLSTQSPRSRSSYGKSVKTSKTSVTGNSSVLDQSCGSASVEDSWIETTPHRALNSSPECTTRSFQNDEKATNQKHFLPEGATFSDLRQKYERKGYYTKNLNRRDIQNNEGNGLLFPHSSQGVTTMSTENVLRSGAYESIEGCSLSSPRTADSPLISSKNVDSDIAESLQTNPLHGSSSDESLSSSSIVQSSVTRKTQLIENSFDIAVNRGLDIFIDNATWITCAASPVASSCNPTDDGCRSTLIRISNKGEPCVSSGSTSATTPTSTSSRDHRYFSTKLSQSFSTSSQYTDAATEVATNRAIDLAMKRIREIEKAGQSAIALEEARNSLLRNDSKIATPGRSIFQPTRFASKNNTNLERKAMESRSLLSCSSNESSMKDFVEGRKASQASTISGRLGFHIAQQMQVGSPKDKGESLSIRSITSSLGVEVSDLQLKDESRTTKNDKTKPPIVAGTLLHANKYALPKPIFSSYTGTKEDRVVRQSRDLRLPNSKDRAQERAANKPFYTTKTYRVNTPQLDVPVANNPCVSPPNIVRRAQSFEDRSPDPIFCTRSSSFQSSTTGHLNSSSKTGSSLSRSFESEDARFMMDSSVSDSIFSPDSHPSRSSFSIFRSLPKNPSSRPSELVSHRRLHGAATVQSTESRLGEYMATSGSKPRQRTELDSSVAKSSAQQTGMFDSCSAKLSEQETSKKWSKSRGDICSSRDEVDSANMNKIKSLSGSEPSVPRSANFVRQEMQLLPSKQTSDVSNSVVQQPFLQSRSLKTANASSATRVAGLVDSDVRTGSKVAQTFLAAISKSQTQRKEYISKQIPRKECIAKPNFIPNAVAINTFKGNEAQQSDPRTHSLLLSRNELNKLKVESHIRNARIHSKSSMLEPLISDGPDTDDDSSVKSLRERFEAPPAKDEKKSSNVAQMRNVFEVKKTIVGKSFQSVSSPLKEAFAKFESKTSDPTSKGSRSSLKPNAKPASKLVAAGTSTSCEIASKVNDRIRIFGGRASTTRNIGHPVGKFPNEVNEGVRSPTKTVTDSSIAAFRSRGSTPAKMANTNFFPSPSRILPTSSPVVEPSKKDVDIVRNDTSNDIYAAKKLPSSRIVSATWAKANFPRSHDNKTTVTSEVTAGRVGISIGSPISHSAVPSHSLEKAPSLLDIEMNGSAAPCANKVNHLASESGDSKVERRGECGDKTCSPSPLESSYATEKFMIRDALSEDGHLAAIGKPSSGKGPLEPKMLENNPNNTIASMDVEKLELCSQLNGTVVNSDIVKPFLPELNISSFSSVPVRGDRSPVDGRSRLSVPTHDSDTRHHKVEQIISDASVASVVRRDSIASLNNSIMKVVSEGAEEHQGIVCKENPIVVKPVALKPVLSDSIAQSTPINTLVKPKPVKPFISGAQTQHLLNSNHRNLTAGVDEQMKKSGTIFRHPSNGTQWFSSHKKGYPLPKDLLFGPTTKHSESELKARSMTPHALRASFYHNANKSKKEDVGPMGHQKSCVRSGSSALDESSYCASVHQNEGLTRNESESEFSDGVTLDVSIAEVSNLTNPTALLSKACDRSESTTGEDYFSDPRSTDFNESEAKRSEASSSQTSEAAHPLLTKVLRLGPMSDEYSSDSFFRTRALLARHWAITTPKRGNQASSPLQTVQTEEPFEDAECKEAPSADLPIIDDGFGGWDIKQIESSFPISQISNTQVDLDFHWNPFSTLPNLPFGNETEKYPEMTSATEETKAGSPIQSNKSQEDQFLMLLSVAKEVSSAGSFRTSSAMTKQGSSVKSESPWRLRASVVQKAINEVDPTKFTAHAEMSSTDQTEIEISCEHNSHEKKSFVSSLTSHITSSCVESPRSTNVPVRETPFRVGPRHAALVSRLSKLKASRLRRATALKNLRSSLKFLPYGSRGHDNDDDRSVSTRGSSTRFGGSSFMAALDLD